MTRKIIEDQATLALRDIQLYPPAFRTTSKKAKEGLVEDWVQGQGWLPARDGVPHGILFYGGQSCDLRWGLLMKETLLVGEYVCRTSMAELYMMARTPGIMHPAMFAALMEKAEYPISEEKDDTHNTLEQGLHIFIDSFDSQFTMGVDQKSMSEFIQFLAYYASIYLRCESIKDAENVWTKKFLAGLCDGTYGNLSVMA